MRLWVALLELINVEQQSALLKVNATQIIGKLPEPQTSELLEEFVLFCFVLKR